MTYEELTDFLEHKMSMSHVYQPLLVRALVDTGGSATLRQLAQVFLAQDESQLLYYEKRIKEMPLKILKRHGVVASNGELVSLSTEKLTLEQKAHIRMICEQKLQSFVKKRGIAIWDYRLLDEEPIPDSLRFQVLKASGGRCQLCGVPTKERPIDVDHIIPRSRGGKTELTNLQALCSKCNRSKRNQDQTDFRSWPLAAADPKCVFCEPEVIPHVVEKSGSVFAIKDKHPVTPGHMLVVPIRHTAVGSGNSGTGIPEILARSVVTGETSSNFR
jgi:ATP adenylyltransferase